MVTPIQPFLPETHFQLRVALRAACRLVGGSYLGAHMQTDIERATGDPGQPCHIEQDIAELIARDFSPEARLARARRLHRPRKQLVRHIRLAKALEVAA